MALTRHISLSQLQSLIRRRLEDAMPLPCWVTGEISEMKVNYSGHCYLELVEKGGGNGIPCAKAQAVIWRNSYGMIAPYFKSETGTELSPGMNVLVKVTVSYHELYGLSLVISDIDPLYTVGDMERQRQKTIAQLHEEGVFDMNRSLPLPVVLQRIAVVSSRNAAGFQDFMNELAASPFVFHVELFDAFMQGHEAGQSVVEALGRICDRAEEFDAVVMIRGGGSQADLAAFDSYRLCCHIAQFPLPVITGIGHDKDHSIADMVAAVPLKTPTAVAGFLSDSLREVDSWLEMAWAEIAHKAVGMIDEENRMVREAGYRLLKAAGTLVRAVETKLGRLSAAIEAKAGAHISRRQFELERLARVLGQAPRELLTSQNRWLVSASRVVESRDPGRIFSLGFALVRSGGKVVTDPAEVAPGQTFEITLRDGRLRAVAKDEKKETEEYGKQ